MIKKFNIFQRISKLEDKVDAILYKRQCNEIFKIGTVVYGCLKRKYHKGPHERFDGFKINKQGKIGKENPHKFWND